MLLSRYPTTLTRSITSGVPLPLSSRKTRKRTDVKTSLSSTIASASASAPAPVPDPPPDGTDPWAAVFDNVSSSLSPCASRKHNYRFSASRPKPYFTSNSFLRPPHDRRGYSTDAKSPPSGKRPDDDSWDHVFEGIDSPPADRPGIGLPPTIAPSASRRPRRKAMTAREISAFDNMFDMIFAAVNKQAQPGATNDPPQDHDAAATTTEDASPDASPLTETSSLAADLASTPDPAAPAPPPAIGRAPSGEMADFFGKLRSHSNRMRRTTEDDELLDRKKEDMQRCETDHELLEWAAREVFHEPARPAPAESAPEPSELARYLADPTYPHVLAHLMRVFRTRYRAPHTALALFTHAKRRSIHSYVFGCTAPAYNERLEALWALEGWAGLGTLEGALAEMRANGVEADARTRGLVERVRAEVGTRVIGREDETSREVWRTMGRVEALVKRKADRRPRKGKLDARRLHWNEGWKGAEDPNLGEDRLTLAP